MTDAGIGWRVAATAAMLLAVAQAGAVTVTVPGTSNPKLAGMPDGTTASSGDVAPNQSPVLAADSGLVAGASLSFAVKVLSPVGFQAGSTSPTPDGTAASYANPSEHGISGTVAPANALMGVFLGPDRPDLTAAPADLNFGSVAARDFASLSPLLKQVFFIGDGLTSDGVVQGFVVPTGATRLYLGTHDGFGWYNNVGAYEVTISGLVPEPQTYALMLGGLALVVAAARRRR